MFDICSTKIPFEPPRQSVTYMYYDYMIQLISSYIVFLTTPCKVLKYLICLLPHIPNVSMPNVYHVYT